MSQKNNKITASTRRRFLKTTCMGVGAAFIAPLWSSRQALAQAGEKLSEDDPTAMALGYKHDAAMVDVAKFPKRAGDEGAKQFCNNCALYDGATDAEWAPCSIFQNRDVKGVGWCNAWVPKA